MLSKRLCITIALTALIVISLAQVPIGYSAESSMENKEADTEQVLDFLSNVIQFDMTKYDTQLLLLNTSYPAQLGGLSYTTGKYSLDSTTLGGTSIIDTLFILVNNKLCSSVVRIKQGEPQYNQQVSIDTKAAAMGILQRYKAFSGTDDIDIMNAMLDEVDISKNTVTTYGNIKLEVSVTSKSTFFQWKYSYNGADYTGIGLSFLNGTIFSFGDDRSYYKTGDIDVNVPKEEAINIALKRADSYSYEYEGKKIANFSIAETQVRANLKVKDRYQPLELYPFWMVDLPLNEVYPGAVTHIQVWIWADTGEVISCTASGSGGDGGAFLEKAAIDTTQTPAARDSLESGTTTNSSLKSSSSDPESQSSFEPIPQIDNASSSLMLGCFAGILIATIGVATLVMLKKRKK